VVFDLSKHTASGFFHQSDHVSRYTYRRITQPQTPFDDERRKSLAFFQHTNSLFLVCSFPCFRQQQTLKSATNSANPSPVTMFSSTVETKQQSHGVGGLCHLVEAATALSKLVECAKVDPPKEEESASAPASPEKAVISDDDDESCKKGGSKNKREIFPQRLMAILNDASLNEIVTWLPNGRSFVIVRPDVFTDTVLPKYLPPVDARGSTKYPSFTRKLNRW
jgi:HSF-type DNA-binding